MKEKIKALSPLLGISIAIAVITIASLQAINSARETDWENVEPLWILEDGTPIYCCQIPIKQFYFTMILGVALAVTFGIAHLVQFYKEKKK